MGFFSCIYVNNTFNYTINNVYTKQQHCTINYINIIWIIMLVSVCIMNIQCKICMKKSTKYSIMI